MRGAVRYLDVEELKISSLFDWLATDQLDGLEKLVIAFTVAVESFDSKVSTETA